MSQVTISGAVSGVDTASIINQLVAVEKNQQTLLTTQQKAVQKRADAYASLVSSLSSLGSLAADLAKTSGWSGSTATSSATSVTATATGTAGGSLTFDVTGVAAAHTLISSSSLSSTSDTAASGPLTLTKNDGSTTTIEVGSGSLTDVMSAINSADAGITATAIQIGPGAYKLQITSSSTGSESSFTVDGLTGFSGTAVLTEGADAVIKVGKNAATAYEVTSSSNTFSGLVPGLSFTVSKEETGVTVGAKIDGGSVADKVSSLVDKANSILSDIASKTAYDVATKTGGPFTGESTVRALQQNILSTVSATGAPGVSLTRDGRLSFDRTKFLSAFAADPAKVARSFGADSSFTASPSTTATSAKVSSALSSARAGTYDVHVTTAPTREQWAIDLSSGVANNTFELTRGMQTVSYAATADDTPESAVAAFNARSAAASFGVTAKLDGTTILFTADSTGAASAFSASIDGTEGAQVTAGRDIAGTIDGKIADGLGSVLSLATGTGGAVGLSILVNTTGEDLSTSGGVVGSITFTPGLAQRLSTLIKDATSTSGTVQNAEDSANSEVKRYQKEIDAWDDRLTAYRETLTKQFTAMETALAKLKSATSAISQLSNSSSTSSSSS